MCCAQASRKPQHSQRRVNQFISGSPITIEHNMNASSTANETARHLCECFSYRLIALLAFFAHGFHASIHSRAISSSSTTHTSKRTSFAWHESRLMCVRVSIDMPHVKHSQFNSRITKRERLRVDGVHANDTITLRRCSTTSVHIVHIKYRIGCKSVLIA